MYNWGSAGTVAPETLLTPVSLGRGSPGTGAPGTPRDPRQHPGNKGRHTFYEYMYQYLKLWKLCLGVLCF